MDTYQQARQWLEEFTTMDIRPGLERVQMMLEGMGNPERKLKGIHVGGTNGKGSTVAFLREPMKEAGIVCGTFTSPYVYEFRERIAVNGEPISEEDFRDCIKAVKPIAESVAKTPFGTPSQFEVLTVAAAHYFATKAFPDLVIWEVGLGGRLDSTNAMHPMVSVITNVGHDHQHILGDTLEDVAREKAGIIKSGVPVITCETNQPVFSVIEETARDKRTKVYQITRDFHTKGEEIHENGWSFSFASVLNSIENVEISMLGRHQMKNAAAALMVFRYLMMYYALPVEQEHIKTGLKKAAWPGRLHYQAGEPSVLIDGAHNKESMESLAEAIQDHFPTRRLHLIVGMTKEKKPEEMLSPFEELPVASVSAVSFPFMRAANAETIAENSPLKGTQAYEEWKQAYEDANTAADTGDLLVIAGSLYFISDVMNELDV
ncbi:dihydrofolate synthase / folylpolyglutamate synthase [Alteribacillus persepolensis]|uniref:Dihydrofolate synthase/folylpolyglutamate synthase n=1 Tax=Alteribacillus persepolensis TaxID=568899 RepID=A0A1G8GQ10_9BACI|nr:folylpolyglutamate synthase/dihydrofolate synthase family protein [Alteribacillus persepolensis]SDH96472.1 dihydrofolate synthase / folylpolyglutamate synthase [Alteribacillus persepolensis]